MPQKQPQLDAFTKIAGMLEDVIFNGSTSSVDREFYTMPHPGIFVSPNLSDKPGSDDMAIISQLFNATFDSTLMYKQQLSTVDQLYSDILTQAAIPKKKLTDKQEKEVDELEKDIDRMYDNYVKYMSRYNDIVAAIYRAQINNEPADVIADLEGKRSLAMQEWKVRGRKEQYEDLEAEVSYYRSLSPRRHFLNLKKRYDEGTARAPRLGEYQSTYLNPPIHEWSSPYSGWAQFSKTFKYSELHKKSKYTKWSGSVGANFGIFKRISLGSNGEKVESYENSENIDIEVKFEYLRVRIFRPWMKSDVFLYRFWTYKKEFGYRLVSSGFTSNSNEPLGPKGLMPVLPTDVVLARNVSISANFSEYERKFMNETLSGSVSGGWGPFSSRGSYRTTTTNEDVVGSFDGTTLRIANPQIIGVMGTMLPVCPNPDRRLPWEEDADFGQDIKSLISNKAATGVLSDDEYLALIEEQREAYRLITKE